MTSARPRGFRELPTLRPLQDGHWWVLVFPLEYCVNGDSITVPAGFKTDFASTPRWLWWLLPPHGRYSAAAIVHDWLYYRGTADHWCGGCCAGHYEWELDVRYRAAADRIFLEAMDQLGVLLGVRRAMYRAVRIFGYRAWRKNALERAAGVVRVLNPVPHEVQPVKRRGLERVIALLHGRKAA